MVRRKRCSTTSSRALGTALLGAAVLIAAAGAPTVAAGASETTEPPTPIATDGSPIAATAAASEATAEYTENTPANGTTVPIVTVESTPSGPKIVTQQVDSAQEARAVATDAARGNDLVAVDTDKRLQPVGGYTNDYHSGSQWGLNPTKTTFLNAWKTTKGGGIVVAVVDTGVAATHPDLVGRVLPGHDFLSPIDRDVTSMTDNCGHGTHVAGTIAANANNFVGVAGAAPNVKILPVRVLNCSGWSSDVAKGIIWAANRGARVINLSLGGPGPDTALASAAAYARSKGAVVIAAAGNNGECTQGKNAISYPGASAGVIGVAAVDPNLKHACFSNSGYYVDLSAPGVNVISTYPPNSYVTMSGTSMATPHIAAAAALVLSYRPTCTPDQVENRLETTAKRPVGGTVRQYGAGLVNPAQAISVLKTLKGKC